MEEQYLLMHKDDPCGILMIDMDSGGLLGYKNLPGSVCAPFLGQADERLMKKWWEARAVPASRNSIQVMLEKAGCDNTKAYLAKNLALSITDTYWICPADLQLRWKDVCLQNAAAGAGKVPWHNMSSYDPNASLGGQMEKYWDLGKKPPLLVKTAYKAYGQQSINEAFASELHRRQGSPVPFVLYTVHKAETDNAVLAECAAFTSEQTELVPALEILESEKQNNDESLYDSFIDICGKHGLDREQMQEFMDYQTLTDFVISNTDEHLMNFGILRDADTMKLTGPAPIFDSGNSMFYADERNVPYKRYELLERRITGIHDKEEKMLMHVRNKKIVKEDLLPTPAETEAFYLEYGLPSEKAAFISKSYEQKCALFRDFQRGKKISLYHEKKKYKGL